MAGWLAQKKKSECVRDKATNLQVCDVDRPVQTSVPASPAYLDTVRQHDPVTDESCRL